MLMLVALVPSLRAQTSKPNLDVAILQFALNLEYLEANFYSCAAFGTSLNASLSGGGPAPTGCMKANLTAPALAYATAIANDEIAHVALLRSALGATYAFAQPQIDIGPAFVAAANAALNTTLSPPFDAYASDLLFYHAAFIFEDVGVTAYKGAASLLTNAGTLTTAAGILATEAYHGGAIRTLLFPSANSPATPYSATVTQVIAAISALRATVSGAADDQGLVNAAGGFVVAPTDANGLAFSRNMTQVMSIVYLGGTTMGGFFPDGLGMSATAAPTTPTAVVAKANIDIAVLQFALNLEYLEANFYSCAAFGTSLNASLSGGGPAPTGCKKANLTAPALAYATAIANDEIEHVAFLRAALGASAFPQPLLNVGTAFVAAANAALSTTLSPPFDAYASDLLFYHAAFIFEDVGVTAYKGAAALLTNGDYLTAAAGILAVEGYHGGAIRTLLLNIATQPAVPYGPATVTQVVAAISALRATVSGAADDQGIINAAGGYIVAPGDVNAVAFSRNTSQVLAIVTLGGTTSGGFFPNGLGTVASPPPAPAPGTGAATIPSMPGNIVITFLLSALALCML